MKKVKKIVVSLLISCMLLLPMATTASAEALADPDAWKATLAMFGIDLDDPESVQKAIDEFKNGGLTGVLKLLGVDLTEMIEELEDFLFAFETETTTKTQPTTTEPPTTQPPTTQRPTYPTYTPQTPTAPPIYTEPEPTTEEPEITYEVDIYTTEPYSESADFVINENTEKNPTSDNPIKTAIGIILLIGSGVGVIVVIVALKRNKI